VPELNEGDFGQAVRRANGAKREIAAFKEKTLKNIIGFDFRLHECRLSYS